MTRYTIRGFDNDSARRHVRRDRLTLGERWRIVLTGDRLRGIGLSMRVRPVHRGESWTIQGQRRDRIAHRLIEDRWEGGYQDPGYLIWTCSCDSAELTEWSSYEPESAIPERRARAQRLHRHHIILAGGRP